MSMKNSRPQPRPAHSHCRSDRTGLRHEHRARHLRPGPVRDPIGLIATGALDAHLPQLTVAISHRWYHLTAGHTGQALAAFAPGDRIRLNHLIRPLYPHGATGTVSGWAGRSVIVQLNTPTGRFTTAEIRCPSLGLEPIGPE